MNFKSSVTALLLILPYYVLSIFISKIPSKEEAAAIARTLVARESLTNVNSVYQSGPWEGTPVSFMEYYADCGDGNPTLLKVDIDTSYKNFDNGSPLSLSVRAGDHPYNDKNVNPDYPGGNKNSPAGSPRVSLRGSLQNVTDVKEIVLLEKCFLRRHKDALWWLPGNAIHSSHWVKFIVSGVYMVGGFGDRAYIGEIDGELYHNATSLDLSIGSDNHIYDLYFGW